MPHRGHPPGVITGDHRDTAVAIAKQLGILTDEREAITGAELNDISDEEFSRTIDHYSVYARVQPDTKYALLMLGVSMAASQP